MNDGMAEITGLKPKTFGRRKVKPRACVADGKRHLRAFMREVLEDLGFVTRMRQRGRAPIPCLPANCRT
jgi:hypothetical protein